jgi:hypothetical protein
VPEVIGNLDALFDPFDEWSITRRLNQVLTDQDFREGLIKHGVAQAKKYSWNATVERAMGAFDRFAETVFRSGRTSSQLRLPHEGGVLVACLIESIAGLREQPVNKKSLKELARCIASSFPYSGTEDDLTYRICKSVRCNLGVKFKYLAPYIIQRFFSSLRKRIN